MVTAAPATVLQATASIPAIPSVPLGSWLLAVSPVVLLLALVLWGRFSTITNAAVTVVYSVAVGLLAFGADGMTVAVGLGKGAWVGLWILYVIWPALLMHHFASNVGMTALGRVLSTILPRRSENVLLLAWILPSFIQGVSGFGTPIAVAAPLLFALGVGAARSVALPLIGYHWAVGFGSMGSSFYMGALTAHLGSVGTAEYAGSASLALGVNCVLAGVLVALMDGGWHGLREGWRLIAVAGPVMAGVQALVARLEPGIGALCAGGAGVVVVLLLRLLHRGRAGELPGSAAVRSGARERVTVPADGRRAVGTGSGVAEGGSVDGRGSGADGGARADRGAGVDHGAGDAGAGSAGELTAARAAAVPYGLLAVIALAVFLPPAAREWAKGHLQVGPSFPATTTSQGVTNPAVHGYNPIALAGHPGTFLLLACLGSVVVWRLAGVWKQGAWGTVWRGAVRQSWKSSPSVVLLASVAGVLVDTGMVRTVARGAAAATGHAYPAMAPLVGALGSFITGSTTSSNALFSALQREVAQLIGDRPADLLAGQLAGGNIGNSLAPVVILLGLSAVGSVRSAGQVLRMTLLPAAVLLLSVVVTTLTLVALH
jgi:lactate permease